MHQRRAKVRIGTWTCRSRRYQRAIGQLLKQGRHQVGRFSVGLCGREGGGGVSSVALQQVAHFGLHISTSTLRRWGAEGSRYPEAGLLCKLLQVGSLHRVQALCLAPRLESAKGLHCAACLTSSRSPALFRIGNVASSRQTRRAGLNCEHALINTLAGSLAFRVVPC